MHLHTVILVFGLALLSFIPENNCPQKIKWKKLRTETEVKEMLAKCIPQGSSDLSIQEFLTQQELPFYKDENGVYFFSAVTRSRSMWIEKKWMVSIYTDKQNKLDSVHVKPGYTGP